MANTEKNTKCGWCGSEEGHISVSSRGAIFHCDKCNAPTATNLYWSEELQKYVTIPEDE